MHTRLFRSLLNLHFEYFDLVNIVTEAAWIHGLILHIYLPNMSNTPFRGLVDDLWPLYRDIMIYYYYYGHIFINGHGVGFHMHIQMDICGVSSHD